MKQTLVEDTMRGAFIQPRLSYDTIAILYLLLVYERGLLESCELLALWNRDHPLSDLAVRRRKGTVAAISKLMCVDGKGEAWLSLEGIQRFGALLTHCKTRCPGKC
jgi:hypothetical protein